MFFDIFVKFNTIMQDSVEETNSHYRKIVQRKVNGIEWLDDEGRIYKFGGFNSENDVVFFSYDDLKNKNMNRMKWVTMTIQESLYYNGKIV